MCAMSQQAMSDSGRRKVRHKELNEVLRVIGAVNILRETSLKESTWEYEVESVTRQASPRCSAVFHGDAVRNGLTSS